MNEVNCLNPCSNGICSLTVNFVNYWESKTYVAKSISKTVFLTKINYIFWGCKIRNFFVPRQKNQYFFNDFLWNIFIFLKITFLHGLENWETLRLFNFQDVKDLYFSRLKIRINFFNCKIFWRFFSKKRWTFFLSTFLFLRPVNILRSFLRSSEKNRKKSELYFLFVPSQIAFAIVITAPIILPHIILNFLNGYTLSLLFLHGSFI